MKVVVELVSGKEREYEFDTKEQMEKFVKHCHEVNAINNNIKKITIIEI